MTITSNLSRVRYLGNGVSTIFAINFPYLTNKDGTAQIAVYVGDSDTPLEEGKDYTVNGFGKYSDYSEQSDEGLITYETRYEGGEVVFYNPPVAQIPVAIVRNVPQTQGVVFVEGEDFPAQDFENALDKLTMEVQEVKENLQRAIVLPPTSTEKPIEIRDNIIQTANEAQNTAQTAIKLIEGAPVIIEQETQEAIDSLNTVTQNSKEAIAKDIDKARVWAEGTQAEVEVLGGEKSARGFADLAQAIANTPEDVPVIGINGDNIYSTYHYLCKTREDRAAIEALLPEVKEAAKKAVSGNIGDIKYTVRTDVPYGGYWCNGQTIYKSELEYTYQMLVDGRLSSVDMTTYDNEVSTNGSCGFFGLDTTNEVFKVPTLTDVYIKVGQAASTFGAESLPNFKYDVGYTGTQGNGNPDGPWDSGGAMYPRVSQYITIDPSTKNAAYQNGAKVNPDHVKYRAYIVLFSSEKELAIANWTSRLNNLAEQLKKELVSYGSTTLTYWD